MFSFPTEKILEKEYGLTFRRIFRRIFLDDWILKTFALLITLALWFGVTGLRAPITTRLSNVMLKPRVSSNMEIMNLSSSEIDLIITGDRRRIDQIFSNNLVVSVDLTDVEEGEHLIQLTPANINVELPTGIKIEEIQPNNVVLKLENIVEREVAVKPNLEGAAADGFEIYSVTAVPEVVRVRGPQNIVKSLDSISTDKINIENQQTDFTSQQVQLDILNPKITPLDAAVNVLVKIGEKRVERLFIVPVYNNENKKATIVLYGPTTLLNNLQRETLTVRMEKAENGRETPILLLPELIKDQVEIRRLKVN